MHARRPFQILSVALISSFLLLLTGPAQAARGEPARAPMPLQTGSLLQGGSLYWNTFLGASFSGWGNAVAVDANGDAYAAGSSTAAWGSPVRPFAGGNCDAFVAKLDGSGTLVWNTFLGGSGQDDASSIAVGANGDIYVAGYSNATWGSPVRPFAGDGDAFVAKLDSSGALLWNTFLGGSATDTPGGIAVDGSGNVVVPGESGASWGSPAHPFASGYTDAFFAAVDANGSLVWNTFLGGSNYDSAVDIALDASGNAYLVGSSSAPWGSPLNAFPGNPAAFVAKLDGSGALTWNTFLGGSMGSYGFGLALDGAGNIYITGQSHDTWGSPVNPFTNAYDAFVAKLNGNGALVWNTFVGGSMDQYAQIGMDVALDADANAYIVGWSGATWGAPVRPYAGDGYYDAFVASVDSTGELAWNTFLGSAGIDYASNIAVDGQGNVYTVGQSSSTWGSPIRPFEGYYDAFVAKLNGSTVLYVKQSATGTNDGTSWTNAYISLQSALAVATSGDQIWVAAGTYLPTANTDRTVSFALKEAVAIYGGFTGTPGTEGDLTQRDPAANVTTLSGDIGVQADASDNSYHVVVGSSVTSSAVLDGFTITAGNANAWPDDTGGGGMQIDGISQITLSAVTFSNNTASFEGGGLTDHDSTGSSLELTNVAFTGNTALVGGGMVGGASNPALTDVTFTGNTAQAGGGMANGNGSPTLTDVTFSNNTATGDPSYGGGGGMYNYGSSPVLTNVDFIANTASTGGGMSNDADLQDRTSNPALTNVTFTGNTATQGGGGMFNTRNSSPVLTNVTFSGNTAPSGGGMFDNISSPALTDVTFSNNTATGDPFYGGGGGMYNEGSSPVLTNVDFNANTASTGGGMSNDTDHFSNRSSNPILTNVTFTSNTATSSDSLYGGGGMHNDFNSSPTLMTVTFTGNSAKTGGGMHNDRGSSPTLKDAIFTNNTASLDGGGMSNHSSSSPQLTNVTFSGNTATVIGGGMANDGGSPTLTNATFSGNTATYIGGMYNFNSSPTLTNVTFSNNTASGDPSSSFGGGGGMYNDGSSSPGIYDSIFWGDQPVEITNKDTSIPTIQDSIVAGGCPSGSTCTNVLNADPKLGPLQDNGGFTQTRALLAGSAAIDAGGGNAPCAATDQRGVARPQGPACDLGAFEVIQIGHTLNLTSMAARDGWVRESGELTNVGGKMNSTALSFRVGDDALNRQYRSILSFNTTLPAAAVVTQVVLKIQQSGLPTGGNPFLKLGRLAVDVKKGKFGLATLELTDFGATPTLKKAFIIPNTPVGGVYTGTLGSSADALINKAGTTQFRLRFTTDDNNNFHRNYMTFFSGDAATGRPELTIYYYIP